MIRVGFGKRSVEAIVEGYPLLTCTNNNDKMHKIKPEQKSLDKDLFRRKPDDKGVRQKLSCEGRVSDIPSSAVSMHDTMQAQL